MSPESRKPLERARRPMYRPLTTTVEQRYLTEEEYADALDRHWEEVALWHEELDRRDRDLPEDQAA